MKGFTGIIDMGRCQVCDVEFDLLYYKDDLYKMKKHISETGHKVIREKAFVKEYN